MPCAYGLAGVCIAIESPEDAAYVQSCAKQAMEGGLFVEWLDAFVAAWEETKDARVAALSGLVEWDL